MKSPRRATAWLLTRCSPRTSCSNRRSSTRRSAAKRSQYLSAAIAVIGGAEFHYVAEWVGPKSAVLEFVTIIDGIEINGVDIIGWNADDHIDRFKVMVRPLKAIEILHQKMAATLSR
jgi:hypothetical protein